MGLFEQKPKIYPFAAYNDLSEEQLPGINIYMSYLNSAFGNSDIRNIVVSGDFGVGKSSIIRSFEKKYTDNNKGNGFLYISLGDYENNGIHDNDDEDGKDGEDGSTRQAEQNAIERKLLLQIYCAAEQKLIPASGFKLIPTHSMKSRLLYAIYSCFIFLSAMIVFFHGSFLDLVEKWLINRGNSKESIMSQVHLWILRILGKNEKTIEERIHTYILTINVYAWIILLVLLTIGIGYAVYYFLPRIKAKALSIKLNSLEASIERKACESYLDQYVGEAVYCLEHIAPKINYTVVIEDIDRLEPKQCLEVFSRMRVLNNMVNQRLLAKSKKKPWYLRFVYLANDRFLSHLDRFKFADYILPVYSRMNSRTAEALLSDKIKEINEAVCGESNKTKSDRSDAPNEKADRDKGLFPSPLRDVIREVADYVPDFRMQSAILNDYSMLLRLVVERNENSAGGDSTASDSLTSEQMLASAQNILAFAVYKNLFPEDYVRIRTNESGVFPEYRPDVCAMYKYKHNELLEVLCRGDEPPLSFECLFYAGYPREQIVGFIEERLKNDPNDNIEKYQKYEDLFCDALQKYLSGFIAYGNAIEKCKSDEQEPNEELSMFFEVLLFVFKYIAQHDGYNWGFSWLINGEISEISVIKMLCGTHHDTVEKIFNLIRNGETENAFTKCKNGGDAIRHYNIELTDEERAILELGERIIE